MKTAAESMVVANAAANLKESNLIRSTKEKAQEVILLAAELIEDASRSGESGVFLELNEQNGFDEGSVYVRDSRARKLLFSEVKKELTRKGYMVILGGRWACHYNFQISWGAISSLCFSFRKLFNRKMRSKNETH